jgi:hypothetical protein
MKMNEIDQSVKQDIAEGSAHGYNVTKWYKKNGNQLKLSKWLRKEAGLPKDAPVYFDDADLVYDDTTIVPNALVNPKLKFNDLLTAVVQATGGTPKQNVDGVYRSQGVEEGRRDYDDLRDTGFGRPERDMSDESNLLYIYKNNRVHQSMISNRIEREARAQGFRDTAEQALKMHGIIRSKFDPKKWVQKQGDKWLQVFPFGNSKDVTESASAGATSSANIATVVNPDQAHSKKPVKSVNALDQDEVSLFGAPMETVKNTAGKKAAIIKRR